MRILVVWSRCRRIQSGQDAGWVHDAVKPLEGCDAIDAIALHRVTTAACDDTTPHGWCLEVSVADGYAPRDVVRLAPFAALLGRLRLFGVSTTVVAIDRDV